MRRRKPLISSIIALSTMTLAISLVACKGKNNPTQKEAIQSINGWSTQDEKELKDQASSVFASISTLPEEQISNELINLGKKLYFDKRLSKNETISCSSCHNLNNYGMDNLPFSPGDTKELGGRNSPTNYYAFLHSAQFWDGRAKDVEEQAGGPLLNPVEHSIPNKAFIEKRLRDVAEYKTTFSKAFPSEKQPITFDNITKAIGAFERQLKPASRFDKWLDGDDKALTIDEKKGMKTFMDAGCITCHSGVALGGMMYQKFGLFNDYWKLTKSKKIDKGRADVTHEKNDEYIFKVPSLRNIAKTYPYFHDGSVKDLGEAVRIMAKLQVNKDLNDTQIKEIVTFLNSLTMEMDEKTKNLIQR